MTTRQLPRGPLTSAFVWQAAVVAAALFSFVLPAYAQSTDATAILKKMSDYVSAQKTLSITFDSDVEVVTADLEKIQFNSSGQVQLSRPDKLRATRLGGYSDVELMFDGKTLTVNSKDRNKFAQIEAPGSVDQLVETLRDKYAVALPGADLLSLSAHRVRLSGRTRRLPGVALRPRDRAGMAVRPDLRGGLRRTARMARGGNAHVGRAELPARQRSVKHAHHTCDRWCLRDQG